MADHQVVEKYHLLDELWKDLVVSEWSLSYVLCLILTIEGLVMFGGLDIKIKRTIKEKFVAFANQMKTMFNNKA
nr:hypothetical protein [Paraglaciecola arctica]